jgi:hypothetical protein
MSTELTLTARLLAMILNPGGKTGTSWSFTDFPPDFLELKSAIPELELIATVHGEYGPDSIQVFAEISKRQDNLFSKVETVLLGAGWSNLDQNQNAIFLDAHRNPVFKRGNQTLIVHRYDGVHNEEIVFVLRDRSTLAELLDLSVPQIRFSIPPSGRLIRGGGGSGDDFSVQSNMIWFDEGFDKLSQYYVDEFESAGWALTQQVNQSDFFCVSVSPKDRSEKPWLGIFTVSVVRPEAFNISLSVTRADNPSL